MIHQEQRVGHSTLMHISAVSQLTSISLARSSLAKGTWTCPRPDKGVSDPILDAFAPRQLMWKLGFASLPSALLWRLQNTTVLGIAEP